MELADLLELIGIIIAVLALISERKRDFIFLKFNSLQRMLLFVALFFIHFLVAYDWFKKKWSWLDYFEFYGFPTSGTWAYFLTISTLTWAAWKIYRGKFPSANVPAVLSYYENLLQKNDFIYLSDLIEKYHSPDIIKYLEQYKAIEGHNQKSSIKFKNKVLQFYKNLKSKTRSFLKLKLLNNTTVVAEAASQSGIDPLINLENFGEIFKRNRKMFERYAQLKGKNMNSFYYHKIINNDSFIDNLTPINPYFFTSIITQLNTLEISNEGFVNRYLKTLITTQNSSFIREIRDTEELTAKNSFIIRKDTPILYALFNDINVARFNQVWRSIGNAALLEIKEEAKKSFSSLREEDIEHEKETLWQYQIYIAICYFDIMVREAIVTSLGHNMFLNYYVYFTEAIIENIKENPEIISRNHDILTEIIRNQGEWIRCVEKTKDTLLLDDITNCLAECCYELAISDTLTDNFKIQLITEAIQYMIEVNNQPISDEIFSSSVKALKNPFSYYFKTRTKNSREYLRVLQAVYGNRDILFRERYKEFNSEVLMFLDNKLE